MVRDIARSSFIESRSGTKITKTIPGSRGSMVSRDMAFLLFLFVLAARMAVGQIAADVVKSQDGSSASTTITSPVFSTVAGNEQLLAFISTDYLKGSNTTVKSVSGGGLTWSLVKRANAQSGSSEIWGAFSTAPLTGVTVTGASSSSIESRCCRTSSAV